MTILHQPAVRIHMYVCMYILYYVIQGFYEGYIQCNIRSFDEAL
jgi:hypothetical protein